mgnify:CR=1 FL=1
MCAGAGVDGVDRRLALGLHFFADAEGAGVAPGVFALLTAVPFAGVFAVVGAVVVVAGGGADADGAAIVAASVVVEDEALAFACATGAIGFASSSPPRS